MALLPLDPDQLLTTTRAVRKRLDYSRPVPDDLIRECVGLALQTPAGSNNPTMSFVVVRDETARKAIGEIYRQCYSAYKGMDGIYIGSIDKGSPGRQRPAAAVGHLGRLPRRHTWARHRCWSSRARSGGPTERPG